MALLLRTFSLEPFPCSRHLKLPPWEARTRRVDSYLEGGLAPEAVDAWVQSAGALGVLVADSREGTHRSVGTATVGSTRRSVGKSWGTGCRKGDRSACHRYPTGFHRRMDPGRGVR